MEKLSNLLTRLAHVWSLGLVALLLVGSLVVQTSLPMDGSEMAHMQFASPFLYLALLVVALVLWFSVDKLALIKSRWLYLSGAAVYLVAGVYMMTHVTWILRHDARMVYESALAINNGNLSSLAEDAYLYRYPHQLGLVSLERLLLTVFRTNSTKVFFGINLILVLGMNGMLAQVTKLWFADRRVTNVFILFSFLFLPQFFFILFAYGLIPGLFFSTLV